MMLAIKAGPQIAAKVGNPAGLLSRRIWYSVGKSGVLGITEYRQGRPLLVTGSVMTSHVHHSERGSVISECLVTGSVMTSQAHHSE